jgi:hypothetical protein
MEDMHTIFVGIYIATIYFSLITTSSFNFLDNQTIFYKINGFGMQIILGMIGLFLLILTPASYFVIALLILIYQLIDDAFINAHNNIWSCILYFLFWPQLLGIKAFCYINSNQRF